MLVMVQREVGERLAAKAGDKTVGIPSLLVAYHGTCQSGWSCSSDGVLPQAKG